MSNIITINNATLPVVEYRGQRVVTLAMVDEVHQRPKDTARRNFNEHRERLIEGEDYFQTTPTELREHFVRTAYEIPANKLVPVQGRGVTLLTESGYLMLVKSMQDDLAWKVQRQLVNAYFRKEPATPQPKPRRIAAPRRESALAVAKAINFIGNMVAAVPGARKDVAAVVALRMIEAETGLPATQFRTVLPAADLDNLAKLNPTEIGARLAEIFDRRFSGQMVNKLLLEIGLQRKTESGWVLTEAGTSYGESRPFSAANKHIGDQVNWYEAVVELLAQHINNGQSAIPQGSLI